MADEYSRSLGEFNTTVPGDGHAISLKTSDDMSYCNARIGGISIAQTGTVATDRRIFPDGLAYERGKELGRANAARIRADRGPSRR